MPKEVLSPAEFERFARLRTLRKELAAYETEPGHGLPIGSLTSQHRANLETLRTGAFSETDFQRHAEPLGAFARQVCSWHIWRGVLEDFGRQPNGLEPREPRRQLEQQREQLPVSEPEQEQPGEPEQQPGVPCGPSSGRSRMASRN